MASPIEIIKDDILFTGLPLKFNAGRYFSWVVDKNNLPPELEITAVDEFGNCMALRHRTCDIRGVQFHPESILSEYGKEIISNWING